MNDPKQRRIMPHAEPREQEAADLEVEHHLEERIDRLVSEGWERREAEAEARRRFGDPEHIRSEILAVGVAADRWAERRRTAWDLLSELARDLRLAARVLIRRPIFTATAVLTLAVAIAGNAAIFGVVNATLLRPLPFPDGDRLMRTFVVIPTRGEAEATRDISWSYPKYELFRDRQDVFEALSLFRATTFTLTGEADPERIDAEVVSEGYLGMLGVEPLVGRGFTPEENAVQGTHYVAMLGHGLWTRRYDADPQVVGRSIRLNDRAYQVVGVLPRGFEGLTGGAEAWVPIMTLPAGDLTSSGSHNKHALGRLKDGVTPEQAKIAVAELGRQVHDVYPGWGDRPEAWGAGAVTLAEERMDPTIRTSVLFIFGAVGFLLLIACVNVANLLLARASTREREVAIRKAMGAGRGRIIRQLLAESGLVAVLGGVTGLVMSYWGVSLVRDLAPVAIRGSIFRGAMAGLTEMGLDSIRFDGSVVLFGAAVMILSVLIFGVAPAVFTAGGDLTSSLKDGGRGTTGLRGSRGLLSQRTLVTAELALTFALLVGSGLMLKSMSRLLADDRGFVADGVLAARVSLPGARYDAAEAQAFFASLMDGLEAVPGVESVGRNHCLPLSQSCNGTSLRFLDGEHTGGEGINIGVHWVNPDYFDALRIPLRRGRRFTDQDRAGTQPVALVSEAAVARYWADSDPLGARVLVNGDSLEVVGVVADVHYETLEEEPAPQVYLTVAQSPRRSAYLILRTSMEPTSLVPALRASVRELDADLPLMDVRTLDERVADITSRPRFGTSLVAVFGVIGLILAAIGIYGVVAFGVAQQTHEIGIRVAIGAERVDVLKMVVGRGMSLALLGVALGLGLVFALGRVLSSVLYGVEPSDPLTIVGTAILLTGVATLASYLPARRAVAVDPLDALRAD
jgi:predicted permease